MRRLLRMLRDRRGDEFAQTAIVMPVIMLMTMALFNLAIAGFASVNAANAANYGARIGSVTQRGSASAASDAAMRSISNARVGDYQISVSGGGFPGATIVVAVQWEVENYMASIIQFLGGSAVDLSGTSSATFRQEGW